MMLAQLKKLPFRIARCRMFGRRVRRFARQQDGTAAVEFGLVAAPFLALLFAIIETAFVFFAGQTLEAAVADSARLIMTGQAQTPGFSQARLSRPRSATASSDCSIARTASTSTCKNYSSFARSRPRRRSTATASSTPRR